MSKGERQPDAKPEQAFIQQSEWADQHEEAVFWFKTDKQKLDSLSPDTQLAMEQAIDRLAYLFIKVLYDQKKLLEKSALEPEQSWQLLADKTLDITHLFAMMAGGFDDDGPDAPLTNTRDTGELVERNQHPEKEELDPRHFYAAYIFDEPQTRDGDILAVVRQAQNLTYPVRYWWLSEAMDIQDDPDRLIICVHHPAWGEDAGFDLYQALEQHQVTWDELEAASMEEYQQLGKLIRGLEDLYLPNGIPLFAHENPVVIEWAAPDIGLGIRLHINNPKMELLPPESREQVRLALARLTMLYTTILTTPDEEFEAANITLDGSLRFIASMINDLTSLYLTMLGQLELTDDDFPF